MAEKEKVKEEVKKDVATVDQTTTEISNNAGTEVLNISEDAFLTQEQVSALLRSENLIEEKLSAMYMKGSEFGIGEEKKFMFIGTRPFEGIGGKQINAVILQDAKGLYINASAALCSDCAGLEKWTVVGITYAGKKPAKVGQMDVWKVSRYHIVKK